MITFWEVIFLMFFTFALTIGAMIVGAWVMYKGKNAIPGEGFTGGVPKGEVFSIGADVEEFPEAPKTIVERTSEFLKTLKEGANQ